MTVENPNKTDTTTTTPPGAPPAPGGSAAPGQPDGNAKPAGSPLNDGGNDDDLEMTDEEIAAALDGDSDPDGDEDDEDEGKGEGGDTPPDGQPPATKPPEPGTVPPPPPAPPPPQANAGGDAEDHPVTDEDFKPEYVPGTDEYFDRLTTASTKAAAERLGIPLEDFDTYNPKHYGALNFFFTRLDQQATRDFEAAKKDLAQERQAKKHAKAHDSAKAKASESIETMLATPDLKAKFTTLLENMPAKKYLEAVRAAQEKNDFSGFIDLAKTAVGFKANLEKIGKQSTTMGHPTKEQPEEEPDRVLVGSDVLGF